MSQMKRYKSYFKHSHTIHKMTGHSQPADHCVCFICFCCVLLYHCFLFLIVYFLFKVLFSDHLMYMPFVYFNLCNTWRCGFGSQNLGKLCDYDFFLYGAAVLHLVIAAQLILVYYALCSIRPQFLTIPRCFTLELLDYHILYFIKPLSSCDFSCVTQTTLLLPLASTEPAVWRLLVIQFS